MKRRFCRALYAGRFQPFHNGHLHAIHFILRKVDELIIAVSACDKNFTLEDPFTCGERIDMIWSSLAPSVRQSTLLIPLVSQENNRVWPSYLCQLLPHFHVAYTNNPLQIALLGGSSVQSRRIPFLHRDSLQGSIIRSSLLKDNGAWKTLVPPSVKRILNNIDAVNRLRSLNAPQLENHAH